MRTHEDSDVLQVCHCLLCRLFASVSGSRKCFGILRIATVGFSVTREIHFTCVVPVTEGQGGPRTSSSCRTGRSRRLRAMPAERDAKTGARIQIAHVGTFRWCEIL